MADYSGPPLRLNRGFFEERDNQFKLLEIFLGIASAIFNTYCYPNNVFLYCTYRVHAFSQIFSVVVINVFFVIITIILSFCNLCGVMDTYYKYNFPLLEKCLTSLASLLYAVSALLLFVTILTSEFVAAWLLPLLFTLWTLAVYGIDCYRRWKIEPRYY